LEYLHSHWFHNEELEPTDLYFEIDNERYPLRGVYLFSTGSLERVTHIEGPIPTIEEIDAMDEFSAVYITKETFEQLWEQAKPA
jgi:hypothetical protein